MSFQKSFVSIYLKMWVIFVQVRAWGPLHAKTQRSLLGCFVFLQLSQFYAAETRLVTRLQMAGNGVCGGKSNTRLPG